MITVKIARQGYRRARQAELPSFVTNVISRTKGVAEYAPVSAEIDALSAPLQTYNDALAAAQNRGIVELAIKDAAFANLTKQLDKLADALENLAGDNSLVLVSAGFILKQSPLRLNGRIEPPVVVQAKSTGKRGEIKIALSDAIPNAVLTHVVEYSTDKGMSWKNGSYQSYNKFVLKGLPASSDLLLQVRSVGRADNVSDPSDPVSVAVL